MTKVLSVASECVPLIKTGGLADVVGALPAAVAEQGVEMRTLLPGYPAVMAELGPDTTVVLREEDCFGGPAQVRFGKVAGLDLYVLDAPHLFQRTGSIYLGPDGLDWPDNPERFAALSWIAARIAAEGADDWKPKVLHLHDWQAGFTPVYLKEMGAADRVATILTVHNIAFQGLVGAHRLGSLRLPASGFHTDQFEYYGQISALKAGLVNADKLTTVSPTYARELTTSEFGMGLDGLLRARAQDLTGILNGIDTEMWNPATDDLIAKAYDRPDGKAASIAALRKEFGLPDAPGPLCVMVSRLTEQKGVDLLLAALPRLLAGGGQLAVLGSGNPGLEDALRQAALDHPNVAVKIGYDEALSHRIIAGGEVILVPSRFEPCGLTQLYGLRYGTLPLVALTGGLADTVIPANAAALRDGVATGFQVFPVTANALGDTFDQVCALYRQPSVWTNMQSRAMAHAVGWDTSASEYAALYKTVSK